MHKLFFAHRLSIAESRLVCFEINNKPADASNPENTQKKKKAERHDQEVAALRKENVKLKEKLKTVDDLQKQVEELKEKTKFIVNAQYAPFYVPVSGQILPGQQLVGTNAVVPGAVSQAAATSANIGYPSVSPDRLYSNQNRTISVPPVVLIQSNVIAPQGVPVQQSAPAIQEVPEGHIAVQCLANNPSAWELEAVHLLRELAQKKTTVSYAMRERDRARPREPAYARACRTLSDGYAKIAELDAAIKFRREEFENTSSLQEMMQANTWDELLTVRGWKVADVRSGQLRVDKAASAERVAEMHAERGTFPGQRAPQYVGENFITGAPLTQRDINNANMVRNNMHNPMANWQMETRSRVAGIMAAGGYHDHSGLNWQSNGMTGTEANFNGHLQREVRRGNPVFKRGSYAYVDRDIPVNQFDAKQGKYVDKSKVRNEYLAANDPRLVYGMPRAEFMTDAISPEQDNINTASGIYKQRAERAPSGIITPYNKYDTNTPESQRQILDFYRDENYRNIHKNYEDLAKHDNSDVIETYNKIMDAFYAGIKKRGSMNDEDTALARTRLDTLRKNSEQNTRVNNALKNNTVLASRDIPVNGNYHNAQISIVVPAEYRSPGEDGIVVVNDPRCWGDGTFFSAQSETFAINAGISVKIRYEANGKTVRGLTIEFTKPGDFKMGSKNTFENIKVAKQEVARTDQRGPPPMPPAVQSSPNQSTPEAIPEVPAAAPAATPPRAPSIMIFPSPPLAYLGLEESKVTEKKDQMTEEDSATVSAVEAVDKAQEVSTAYEEDQTPVLPTTINTPQGLDVGMPSVDDTIKRKSDNNDQPADALEPNNAPKSVLDKTLESSNALTLKEMDTLSDSIITLKNSVKLEKNEWIDLLDHLKLMGDSSQGVWFYLNSEYGKDKDIKTLESLLGKNSFLSKHKIVKGTDATFYVLSANPKDIFAAIKKEIQTKPTEQIPDFPEKIQSKEEIQQPPAVQSSQNQSPPKAIPEVPDALEPNNASKSVLDKTPESSNALTLGEMDTLSNSISTLKNSVKLEKNEWIDLLDHLKLIGDSPKGFLFKLNSKKDIKTLESLQGKNSHLSEHKIVKGTDATFYVLSANPKDIFAAIKNEIQTKPTEQIPAFPEKIQSRDEIQQAVSNLQRRAVNLKNNDVIDMLKYSKVLVSTLMINVESQGAMMTFFKGKEVQPDFSGLGKLKNPDAVLKTLDAYLQEKEKERK